jgi:hypothetical protein
MAYGGLPTHMILDKDLHALSFLNYQELPSQPLPWNRLDRREFDYPLLKCTGLGIDTTCIERTVFFTLCRYREHHDRGESYRLFELEHLFQHISTDVFTKAVSDFPNQEWSILWMQSRTQRSTLDRVIVFVEDEHQIEMTERRYSFANGRIIEQS